MYYHVVYIKLMMQPPGPLPNPSLQIHQQLLDYPPLPPIALAALALGVEALHTRWHTCQLMWLYIPQGSGMQDGVGPRQEGAYMCTCPCWHLLHMLPPHLSMCRHLCLHLVTTLFTHPLVCCLISAPPSCSPSLVHAHVLLFVFTLTHLGVLVLVLPLCVCVRSSVVVVLS